MAKLSRLSVKADGEKAVLVGDLACLSIPMKELRRQVEIELGMHLRSVREINGEIRDDSEIYEIACLLKIRELLRAKKK